MPKLYSLGGRHVPNGLQGALDSLDVVGAWTWDAASDRARADTYVALLFDVDPDEAEAGLPIADYVAGIHPVDQPRVLAAFRAGAREGKPYGLEYRVRSADGVTRWVLTRGRFLCDHLGHPVSGRGIVVDITCLRSNDPDGDLGGIEGAQADATPLDQAAAAAIQAYRAIDVLGDPELKARAEALLFDIGRKLAVQELGERRSRLS